jgi:hypothetical protein
MATPQMKGTRGSPGGARIDLARRAQHVDAEEAADRELSQARSEIRELRFRLEATQKTLATIVRIASPYSAAAKKIFENEKISRDMRGNHTDTRGGQKL